jgi:tRNA-splicing ligase RtcB
VYSDEPKLSSDAAHPRAPVQCPDWIVAASRGILIRSPSLRGVAEEAPDAYKDVSAVVDVTDPRLGITCIHHTPVPAVCGCGDHDH